MSESTANLVDVTTTTTELVDGWTATALICHAIEIAFTILAEGEGERQLRFLHRQLRSGALLLVEPAELPQ